MSTSLSFHGCGSSAALLLFAVVTVIVWRMTTSLAAIASVSFFVALLGRSVPQSASGDLLVCLARRWWFWSSERPSSRWSAPCAVLLWASVHGSWVIGAGYLAVSVLERREYREFGPRLRGSLATTGDRSRLGCLRLPRRVCRAIRGAFADHRMGVRQIWSVSFARRSRSACCSHVRSGVWSVVGARRRLCGSSHSVRSFVESIGSPGRSDARSPRIDGARRPAAWPLRTALVGVRFDRGPRSSCSQSCCRSGRPRHEALPGRSHRARRGTRLFHDDVIGGYIIYAEWPGIDVLIDDRAELYGDELSRFVDVSCRS